MEKASKNSYRNAPKQDSLARRTYNSARNLAYGALIAGAAYLAPSLNAQEREMIADTFANNVISRSYIEENPGKWPIQNEELEGQDFDSAYGDANQSGVLRFSLNDQTHNLEDNLLIQQTFKPREWGSGVDYEGMIIQGDPAGESYLTFEYNNHPNAQCIKYRIMNHTPKTGSATKLAEGCLDFLTDRNQPVTLTFAYNNTGTEYNSPLDLVISNERLNFHASNGIESAFLSFAPHRKGYLEGSFQPSTAYVGVTKYDSMGGGDPAFAGLTRVASIITEKDVPIGGGGASIRVKTDHLKGRGANGMLIPDKLRIFMRGDSNMDGSHDISDPINTLNYLFGGNGNVSCADAADVNGDGQLDISDAIMSLTHLFADTSQEIPYPNRTSAGPDTNFGINIKNNNLPECIVPDYSQIPEHLLNDTTKRWIKQIEASGQ